MGGNLRKCEECKWEVISGRFPKSLRVKSSTSQGQVGSISTQVWKWFLDDFPSRWGWVQALSQGKGGTLRRFSDANWNAKLRIENPLKIVFLVLKNCSAEKNQKLDLQFYTASKRPILRKQHSNCFSIRFLVFSILLGYLGVENTQLFTRNPNFEVPGPKTAYFHWQWGWGWGDFFSSLFFYL